MQDNALVERVCELGEAGISVIEIDKTLHREQVTKLRRDCVARVTASLYDPLGLRSTRPFWPTPTNKSCRVPESAASTPYLHSPTHPPAGHEPHHRP